MARGAKGERTREEIIRKAAAVFNQRGFAGATLTELMEATGLQKGGIYNHFGSKEQLALEAFDYAVTVRKAEIDAALESKKGAVEKLLAALDAVEGFPCEGSLPGGCPLMNTAMDADDTNPALAARAREAFAHWHAQIAAVAREGIAQGELRRTADPDAVATLFLANIEGGAMLSSAFNDLGRMHQALEHLRRYVVTELKAES